jgi:glycosyltransferase involved in cell wall biosynthesis
MLDSDELPLVSVVISTYDRPEFLFRAIETVNNQTYDRIELIIVDDHSPKSPEDIVKSAPDKELLDIELIRHDANKGVSAARNTGIRRASGELIALLDDDDLWIADKIERQVAEFHRSGDEVGVVCTGIRSVDADGTTINTKQVEHDGDVTKRLLCGAIIPLPSILVRRDLLVDAGLFDKRLKSYEDAEWIIRLSQHCEFRSVSDPLVISVREGHVQKSDDVETKVEEAYPLFMEKCRPIAAEYGRLFERKMVGHWSFRAGYASLAHGRPEQARRLLRAAILTWPLATEFYLYALFAALGNQWYMRARTAKRRIAHRRHELTAGT